MKLNRFKLIPALIAATVVVIACFVQALPRLEQRYDFLERWEWDTYDWRVRMSFHFPAETANNLGAIFIDDEGLARMNETQGYSFPWPRHVYAQVVEELHAQGAKAVAFDIIFAEANKDSVIRLGDGSVVSSDQYFAEKMQEAGNVIVAATEEALPAPLFAQAASAYGDIDAEPDPDGVLRRAHPFQRFRVWHPILRTAASEYALDLEAAEIQDGELLLRNVAGDPVPIPLYGENKFSISELVGEAPAEGPDKVPAFEEKEVWHLGVLLAARELGLDLDAAEIREDRIILPGEDGLTRIIPVDEDGFMLINWTLRWNDIRLKLAGFHELLNQGAERKKGAPIPPAWKDRLVVIGSTVSGNNFTDSGPTPVGQKTYLVSKHWNVANSIIKDQMVRRSAMGLDLLILALVGGIAFLVSTEVRAPWSSLSIVGVAGIYVSVAVMLYVHLRLWVPVIVPVAGGLFLTHIVLVSYQVIFEQQEKRRVRGVFSKLVSPAVVNELLSSSELNLGGSRRNITVMFSDVRGFTSMTDEYQKRAVEYVEEHHLEGDEAEAYFDQQAQETLATVNIYLGTISNMVKKHGGTLDKYMGDCVMAFWGAPVPNEKHALACVEAAVDAQRAMYQLNLKRMAENRRREKLNEEREKNGEEPLPLQRLLALGSGINTGISIVGLMGSDQHILNFTVFGREVNLASRLESVSGRGRIVVGESTYHAIRAYAPEYTETFRELDAVMVKGISTPVRNFEVPWRETWEEREALELEILGEVLQPEPEAEQATSGAKFQTVSPEQLKAMREAAEKSASETSDKSS